MPFSYAQYAGNGSATTFSVPFPYLLKAHVKLFYGYDLVSGTSTSELADGVGFTWTTGTQVQTTVAPAVGQTLAIVRQTPSNALVVQWQDGSNLLADDLQDSSLQNLYSVQEQKDVVSLSAAQSATAATSAAAAVTTANAASTTANAASTTANGISGTANTALSNSAAAVTTANAASATANGIAATANTASSNASAAVTTANAANATANGIAGTAATALTNANAAVATANAAEATANGIAGTANTALSNSSAAVTTANAASTTANGIAGTANTALTTANAALPKAGGTMTGAITFAGAQAQATTSAVGIVQLSSSTSSTSETLAATPKAVQDAIAIAISSAVPTGTVMLFQQTSAPTGWTKITTHDNKALRVVSGNAGTGGSTGFSSVFASRTPGGSVSGSNSGGGVHHHTLSTAEMPSHTHAISAANLGGSAPFVRLAHTAIAQATTQGTNATGDGNSHAHGFSPSSWSGSFSGSAMDFAVAYVDIIFASKN